MHKLNSNSGFFWNSQRHLRFLNQAVTMCHTAHNNLLTLCTVPAWPSALPDPLASRSFEGAGTHTQYFCVPVKAGSTSPPCRTQLGCWSDLTPPSGHAIRPLREKEVDPLWYGLASLGGEQSLLFGDVQHRLGHLVQRRLIHLHAPGCEGVAGAQFDVAVLEGQERHKKVDQVAGHQVTLSEAAWKEGLVRQGGRK